MTPTLTSSNGVSRSVPKRAEEIETEIERLTDEMGNQGTLSPAKFAMYMLTVMVLKWTIGDVSVAPTDVVFRKGE